MKITFQNLHLDGPIKNRWDYLIRNVGDISIILDGELVYWEEEFCLVEFAVQTVEWLCVLASKGEDFSYSSLEHESPSMIAFVRVGLDWKMLIHGENCSNSRMLDDIEICIAFSVFVTKIRQEYIHKFDIYDLIQDVSIREWAKDILY